MQGLDPSIAKHNLNVKPDAKSVKQKIKNFTVKRPKVIEAEVENIIIC